MPRDFPKFFQTTPAAFQQFVPSFERVGAAGRPPSEHTPYQPAILLHTTHTETSIQPLKQMAYSLKFLFRDGFEHFYLGGCL